MKIVACIQTAVFLAAFSFASGASAQVYKCTFADNQTHQNKVVYTDMPCHKSAQQTITDISEASKNSVKNQKIAYTTIDLDNAVTQAVLNKNFALAKSLAKTKEHWRLIAITENATPVSENDKPENVIQSPSDNACERAQHDFDSTSQLYWRDRELVAAKKSVMYALCGVPEGGYNQQYPPIIVAQPYYSPHGNIHNGRWYGSPFPAVNPAQAYHRPLPHVNHFNGVQTGGSVNLNYRSRRFGVEVSGFNQAPPHFAGYEPYSW
jgi:hypothetical protein